MDLKHDVVYYEKAEWETKLRRRKNDLFNFNVEFSQLRCFNVVKWTRKMWERSMLTLPFVQINFPYISSSTFFRLSPSSLTSLECCVCMGSTRIVKTFLERERRENKISQRPEKWARRMQTWPMFSRKSLLNTLPFRHGGEMRLL